MNRVASADNSDAMSLFPFLAVLLCTMGALIVLLVVVAHQSRLQASQEAAMPPPEASVATSAADQIDEEKLTSQIAKLRAAIDSAKHPALLKEFIWSGYLRFNFIYFQMLAYTSFTLTISASYIE